MKILLLLPDGRGRRINLRFWKFSFREAPLTLTTLAALIPEGLNAEIRLVDESVESIPHNYHPDLVGISCMTGTVTRGYELADKYRQMGATVILGGVHPSAMPEEASEHADAVVVGFAEETWPQLLRDFFNGNLQKLYKSTRKENFPESPLPTPRRDLQQNLRYASAQSINATRGCRGSCEFCSVPFIFNGFSTRPLEHVIDEIKDLSHRRFAFSDVNLLEDREYALELLNAMADMRPIKSWGALANLCVGEDEELVDALGRAGCVFLLVGMESISPATLKGMNKKHNTVSRYTVQVENLQNAGIVVQGCLVFGFDTDTIETFDETVQAVEQIGVDIPRYALLTPYPGTRLFKRLEKENRILHHLWQYYDTQHVVFQPAQMSPSELASGYIKACEQTYSFTKGLKRGFRGARRLYSHGGNLAYWLDLPRLRRETLQGIQA